MYVSAANNVILPHSPTEIAVPLPSEDQNAAPIYRRIMQQLTAYPLSGEDTILEMATGKRMPDAVQTEQIRRALQHRQDIMQLIHQAAERPQCVFNWDYAQGPDLQFPEFAKMRSSVRILTAESALLLADGKPLEAIRNQVLGFRIARHAAQEPLYVGNLVGIADDAITLGGLQKCLYAAGDQPGVAQAIREAVERNWKPRSMIPALQGEAVFAHVTMDMIRKRGPSVVAQANEAAAEMARTWRHTPEWEVQLQANETDYRQRLQQAIVVVDLPYSESGPVFDELNGEVESKWNDPYYTWSVLMTPIYKEAAQKRCQIQAVADVTRCAAAVLVYRQQHGAFPDRLEQAISPIPADAFDTQPLRYRRDGGGFVVYSVGERLNFDGGTRDVAPKKYETQFWYPMPAYAVAVSAGKSAQPGSNP